MTKDFSKESYEGADMGEMDKSHEILKRLARLIELIEEQNDILLFAPDEPCCPGCDGNCGEED